MSTDWVDFKKVKEAVNMQMVLDHYGIKGLVKSGDELRGPCPIHKGSHKSKNFTVNVQKNAFKCFSNECGAHGNVLDFVSALEKCAVREAALKLRAWFKVGNSESSASKQQEATNEGNEVSRGIYRDQAGAVFEVITIASSAEDFEPLVVYRELFGNYKFWVAPLGAFVEDADSVMDPVFTMVKAL